MAQRAGGTWRLFPDVAKTMPEVWYLGGLQKGVRRLVLGKLGLLSIIVRGVVISMRWRRA